MLVRAKSANHFLASLSEPDFRLLQPHLQPVELPRSRILHHTEETIREVYFPYTGLVSHVLGTARGQLVEVGLSGRNTVVGAAAALDDAIALNCSTIQIPGSAVMVKAAVARDCAAQSKTLRASLYRFERAALAQVQHLAACNSLHPLEERLSRWLSQTRDIVQSSALPLTHEFLCQMLGVQRSSISVVARNLQRAGLIDYHRGHIRVLDSERLRGSACECYEAIKLQLRRLISWTPDF